MALLRYQQYSTPISPGGVPALSGLPFADLLYTGGVQWHIVSPEEAGRLDLISWKWFSDYSYFYYIALLNSIKDPINDVQPGVELAIPVDLKSALPNIVPLTYLQT